MGNNCKLLFVGDVVMENKPDFSSELNSLFESADIRCCNFEAPLQGLGSKIIKTGPHVNQHKQAANWIKELGFNLFSLANNHIYDYGEEAMSGTKKAFLEGTVLGVGDENEAYGLIVKEINGLKIGFVAYGENGYGAINGDRNVGYAWINHPRVNEDIRRYKQEVDALVVQIHAGVELLDVPIPEWRARYQEVIDCGADLIVGHHPHIVQGYELYKDKYIFYSLGNFYFDYQTSFEEWNVGAVLEVLVNQDKTIAVKMHIVEKQETHLKLLNSAQAKSKLSDLNQKLNHSEYLSYVNEKAIKLWNKYHEGYYAKVSNGIQDYSIKGILKHVKRLIFNRGSNINMLWHNLFIESNVWLVKRAVQEISKK